MRFRHKLFLSWAGITLTLWLGAFWAIEMSVERSFDKIAHDSFAATKLNLQQFGHERTNTMRQACSLVFNIPDLRALIAEQSSELVPENVADLKERLDYLTGVVGVSFTQALNSREEVVSQSQSSPWSTLEDVNAFLDSSTEARAFREQLFHPQPDKAAGQSRGLESDWVYHGRLYHVSGVPLVFQSGAAAVPDGALVMGTALTDQAVTELGKGHNCEITFLAGGQILASSVAASRRQSLLEALAHDHPVAGNLFSMQLAGDVYHSAITPVVDPCSGTVVGSMLIQRSQMESRTILRTVGQNLAFIIATGLLAAALASLLLGAAITRPVQQLSEGVRSVAQGNLELSLQVRSRDELGELATAFNAMVRQIRDSRADLELQIDETKRYAQREHLLHDVARYINQRLDVQSTLRMFVSSLARMFPGTELEIFRYDAEQKRFQVLEVGDMDSHSATSGQVVASSLVALNDPACVARLLEHEPIRLPDVADLPGKLADLNTHPAAIYLVPILHDRRLMGAVSVACAVDDGFADHEHEFLQSLADHFAIALGNAQVHEELARAYQNLRDNQQQIIQSERLSALGQMASGIAHDFNNHLTGVLGFLEIVLEQTNLPSDSREYLEMARESSLAAAEVVTLLRNFYRKRPDKPHEEVDLNQLVEKTISLTRPRWFDMPQQSGIVVQVKSNLGQVGLIRGQASELQTALTNLLFNAVDALPQGGDVTLSTYLDGDRVVLEVRDTGMGMSPEVREHCLDPFYTTKGVLGTGLGLSMVHGAVERHQGQLLIDSAPGAGTAIRLCFPAHTPPAALQKPIEEVVDNRPKKILCVDDDLRVLRYLEDMLRHLGHTVKTSSSGAGGRSVLTQEKFDVVITDLGMPEVDGRQIAAIVKEQSPKTHVILLTGWAERLVAEGEVLDGVDQVLGKPITKDLLQQALTATRAFVAPDRP